MNSTDNAYVDFLISHARKTMLKSHTNRRKLKNQHKLTPEQAQKIWRDIAARRATSCESLPGEAE